MNRQPEHRAMARKPSSTGGRAAIVTPVDFGETLAESCDHLNLRLGSGERECLLSYLVMLQRWNRVYNLTAIRDPRQMLIQHLFDCLAVMSPLQAALASHGSGPSRAPALLDVGSGAGLPGLVLAIAWPELEVDLVEPVGKKAAFLRQSAAELGLTGRVRVHGCRIEAAELARSPDLAICRAFASLADYVSLIEPLLAASTQVFAMKGQLNEIEAEAAALPRGWRISEIAPLSVPGLAAARHLVQLAPLPESTHA
jgi:16S rRNA (guanine527-N7)-methyltransferase